MKRTAVVWTASIVVVALGLGGRAGAQNVEIVPPDAPPEVTPATPPEGAPAAPPDGSPPAEAPATGSPEAPAKAATAAAAAFGEAWHYAISLERAVGYDHVSLTQGSYGKDSGTVNGKSTTASNFSLFGAPWFAGRVFTFDYAGKRLWLRSPALACRAFSQAAMNSSCVSPRNTMSLSA